MIWNPKNIIWILKNKETKEHVKYFFTREEARQFKSVYNLYRCNVIKACVVEGPEAFKLDYKEK